MGEAGSLAAVSQGVGGLSSAAGGYSNYMAYKAQGAHARRMGNVNAKLAELESADALRRGNEAQVLVGQRAQDIREEQRVGYAAGGVDVNSGTAKQVQEQTTSLSVLDQLAVQNNAALEALGYRMQSTAIRGDARMQWLASKNAANQSLISGGMGFAKGLALAGRDYDKYHITVPGPTSTPGLESEDSERQSMEAAEAAGSSKLPYGGATYEKLED